MKNPSWIKNKPKIISTGPTSEAGKEISSRNATKHGCCSNETLILPHESPEEFKSLEHSWFRAYEPKGEAETHLLRQMIHADWFLQRSIRTTADAEAKIYSAVPDALEWTEDHHRTLARFLRYQTARTNQLAKHRKELENYRKNRVAEVHKEIRLKVFQEKNKPKLTWRQELEEMRNDPTLKRNAPGGAPSSVPGTAPINVPGNPPFVMPLPPLK